MSRPASRGPRRQFLGTVAGAFVLLLTQAGAQRRRSPDTPSSLLMDASGRELASHWDDPDRPGPIGSLVKPFTALAYAAAHEYRYPTVTCRGDAGRCWLPGGHGPLGIVEAVAESCNDYFFLLASRTSPDAFAATLRQFGLGGGTGVTPDGMVGLGAEIEVTPAVLARAYLEIVARRGQPGVDPVLEGMLASSRTGTGAGVGRAAHLAGAFVKTGTSPCVHAPQATADGHTVVVYPADGPRVVLVVRAHGRTGADTAVLAGEILAAAPEAR